MTHKYLNKDYHCVGLSVEQNLLKEALEEWHTVHDYKMYDISTARERMSPALSRTRSYYLRSPNVPREAIKTTSSTQNVLDCTDTALYERFPLMKEYINHVGLKLYGGWTHMGRVFVTKLESNAKIGRHIDEGDYFRSLHRFHIVLKSTGSRFCWDGKQEELKEGRLYMVNNSIPHWVENTGTDRTHLIFDAA